MKRAKEYIDNYINFYLENDDELTKQNEKKFREIQSNEDIMNKLAKELCDYEILSKITDEDLLNYERNHYIYKLLTKEI